jgi:NAD(P)-dependent dehydrogenase (short-subunit alcohol dehydrogenase family)
MSRLPLTDSTLKVPCHYAHGVILPDTDAQCVVEAGVVRSWQDSPMTEFNYPQPAPIGDWNRLLEGRVAVVTGGGTGIGGSISRLFAQHGAIVEIIDIDPSVASEAVSDIQAAGGIARAHVADCRDWEKLQGVATAILTDHPHVQVLVNNVGDYRPLERFRKSSPDSWKAMYDINFFAMVASTKCFIESMIDGGSGSIVNVHSVEGMRGYPGDPIYGAMKAASAKFSTDLALSMGRNGIRVNGIGPDLTQTPQVDYISTSAGSEHLWEAWAPVGRLGWPEDQARVALFLASDLSAYVTGHNIPVDGGTKAGAGWFYSPAEERFTNRPKGL